MFIGNSEEYVETTFKFDMENYFSSFNNGGAASVANGISDAVTNFFTKAPKAKYYASFTAASDQYSYKQTINETYEYTITKFNGQSLANTNGEFSDVKDAIVEISGKEEVEVNKEETYNIYAHDMFVKDENLTATVTKDSEVIKTINLNEVEQGYYIDIDSAPEVRIRVEKGRIRFCDADCPDKLCIRYGWLESSADSAVCLPAKVVISISGQKDGSPDVITY